MKRTNWNVTFVCASLVSMLMLVPIGCLSTSKPLANVDAYKLGRLTAVAYLSQKDKLSENDVKVVTEVYKQFDAIVTQNGTETDFKQILFNAIAAKSDLKPADMALVTEVLNLYWGKLDTYAGINKLLGPERLIVLQDFNRGVKEAMNDYNFLVTK